MFKKVFFFLSCFLLVSCQKKPELEISAPQLIFAQAPVQLVYSFSCPVCQKDILPCQIEERGEAEFNKAISKVFEAQGIKVVKIEEKNRREFSPKSLIRWCELAKVLNAEKIIVPVLFCWQERKGSAISVSLPAQVGFHLHIFDVKSYKLIWSGGFQEKQEPLSANLFELDKFIKRGGKWLKAEELAREGLEKLVKEYLDSQKQNASNTSN